MKFYIFICCEIYLYLSKLSLVSVWKLLLTCGNLKSALRMLTIKKMFNRKAIDFMFVGKTISVIVTTYNKHCLEILLLHQCTFSFHCFTQNDRLSYIFLWGFRLINIGINDLRTFNQSERDHEYINITVMYIQHYNIYPSQPGEKILFFGWKCWTISAPGLSLCWTVEVVTQVFPAKRDQQISSNWPQLIDIKLNLLNTFNVSDQSK